MGNESQDLNVLDSGASAQQMPPVAPNKSLTLEDLSYLPPPAYVQHGMREKLIRKCKENPAVPLGVIFTTVVLGLGLGTMTSKKHRHRAQLLMRLRVGGQAFAICAILAGVWHSTKTG